MPTLGICGESFIAIVEEKKADPALIILGKEREQMNSKKSIPHLKHGEEPTALLLALASSPIETLCQRNEASILSANGLDGKPVVLAIFNNATWEDGLIVLADGESVGKEIANGSEKEISVGTS